jgi:hypothetical protein
MGIFSAIKILINDNKIHYHMSIERVVSKLIKTNGYPTNLVKTIIEKTIDQTKSY